MSVKADSQTAWINVPSHQGPRMGETLTSHGRLDSPVLSLVAIPTAYKRLSAASATLYRRVGPGGAPRRDESTAGHPLGGKAFQGVGATLPRASR